MSQPLNITIACGGCGSTQPFTVWESLDAASDRDQKERLLQGALDRFTCGHCGWSADVAHQLVYQDRDKKFMVWLVVGDDLPGVSEFPLDQSMADFHLRLVQTNNQLIEKVLILDSGYDDRVIEIFKQRLLAGSVENGRPLRGELLFGGRGVDQENRPVVKFDLVSENGTKEVAVSADTLNQTQDKLMGVLPSEGVELGQWLRVDAPYARELLEKLKIGGREAIAIP